jgi:hypothetical protein
MKETKVQKPFFAIKWLTKNHTTMFREARHRKYVESGDFLLEIRGRLEHCYNGYHLVAPGKALQWRIGYRGVPWLVVVPEGARMLGTREWKFVVSTFAYIAPLTFGKNTRILDVFWDKEDRYPSKTGSMRIGLSR